MNITEIVKDNEVRFVRYRQGHAYYAVRVPSEDADYGSLDRAMRRITTVRHSLPGRCRCR